MEYLCDHGSFEDLPYERMIEEYEVSYPHLHVKEQKSFGTIKKAKFEDEVNT